MLKISTSLLEVSNEEKEESSRSRKTVTKLGRLPQFFPETNLRNEISQNYDDHSPRVTIIRGTPQSAFVKRANRFLEHQEIRINKALKERDFNKAAFIWMILLKTSFTYQVCLMNRVVPS